jgi:tight adherence protein C
VPLSEALNDIAADMRRAAHQAARRRAARATPRVSLIVTTLILPGTMILIAVSIVLGSGLQEAGLFQ